MTTDLKRRHYARKLRNLPVDDTFVSRLEGQPTVYCPRSDHETYATSGRLRPGNRVHVLSIKRDGEWELETVQCLVCEPPYGLDDVPEELRGHEGAIVADATLYRDGQELLLREVRAYDGYQSLPGFD